MTLMALYINVMPSTHTMHATQFASPLLLTVLSVGTIAPLILAVTSFQNQSIGINLNRTSPQLKLLKHDDRRDRYVIEEAELCLCSTWQS